MKFSVFQLGVHDCGHCEPAKTRVALHNIPKFMRENGREQKCEEEREVLDTVPVV